MTDAATARHLTYAPYRLAPETPHWRTQPDEGDASVEASRVGAKLHEWVTTRRSVHVALKSGRAQRRMPAKKRDIDGDRLEAFVQQAGSEASVVEGRSQ